MAITFTRALPVASGDRVTSSNLANLAAAFNDRIRSGVGDMAWRICWYWFNLWRQVRNPADGGFLFPSQGEFFELYQLLDPEYHGGDTWPVAGPGEDEGANLANPMMQFVFGLDPNIAREDVRLNDEFQSFAATTTLEDFWNLGKDQRGLYDPSTGAQNTPALDRARDFFDIVQPFWSPHGKAYGGFLPSPVELFPDCGATELTGLGVPSLEYFFTGLRTDVSTAGLHGTITTDAEGRPIVTYAGSCPCGTDNVATGHIQGIVDTPSSYIVYVLNDITACTSDIDRLSKSDWIIGPFTGPAFLNHTLGEQLNRALWQFDVDFRGADSQRTPDTFKIKKIGFDYQQFSKSQYYLAPNKGQVSGDSIESQYPYVEFGGSLVIQGGTLGDFGGGTTRDYTTGFVCTGMFAKATKLAQATNVQFLNGSSVFATLILTPDNDGNAQAMLWLKTTVFPEPLSIRLGNDARFTAADGKIAVETNELYEYRPNYWDAYLLNRLTASSNGDQFGSGVDGRGKDYTASNEISKNYFKYGCIPNTGGVRDSAEWVNDNPVFDAARRLSRDHVRIMRRQQFVSYEVPGDGTCVFRFQRFAYGLHNTRADCFHDIAPPIDPITSGELIEGETYIVRGAGSISYLGTDYYEGSTFTAVTTGEFATVGTARVHVLEGIRHTARKKGFTNEWVMLLQTLCYHPSETSEWKPTAYADYFTFCNRCHFYSGTATGSLRRFFTYNHSTSLDAEFNPTINPISVQAQFLSPEAPSGFNYAMNANRLFGGSDFYKSCQIYQKPYEIESCTVETWDDAGELPGNQIIKCVFKERLRSHEDAPATVDKDPNAWSAGDIDSLRNAGGTPEDYRTDDNSIREYALSEANGNYPCVFRTGDAGTGSAVSGLPDNPFGACYPHFLWCRLAQSPYEDGNDTVQAHDSRTLVDQMLHMEVMLRAGCEGFVDGQTSIEIICARKDDPSFDPTAERLFDYVYENLCFEAFEGRSIGAFSTSFDPELRAGFGPLPNTVRYAEVFNRFVSCVNLLDKARIDVPIRFNWTESTFSGSASASPTMASGTADCHVSGATDSYAYLDGAGAPAAGTPAGTAGPFTGTAFNAHQSAAIQGCPFTLDSLRVEVAYATEIEPAWSDSIPADIQDLINLGATGFLAATNIQVASFRREVTTAPNGDGCSPPGATDQWFDSSTPADVFRWPYNVNTTDITCGLVASGTLNSPGLPSSDYAFGYESSGPALCQIGPSTSTTITLLIDNGAFIQVPLV